MVELSAFYYARIAAEAEDRLLRLFDEPDTTFVAIADPEDEPDQAADKEEDHACAG